MAKIKMTATVNYKFLMDCQNDPVIDTVVLEGSTRSSKTYSIIQYLIIEWCIKKEGSAVRCFRYDSTTHNTTTIADFKEIMRDLGLWESGSWNGQEKIFRFLNGSVFAFSATSDKQKLHGLKQDVAYYNEVMEIPEESHTQISYRTTELTIMDFNPSFSRHWVFQQLIDTDLPNVAYKHSTYKDNPFLTPKQIDEIEKYEPTPENKKRGTADDYKWSVWGLGKRGKIEGAVFKLYEVVDFFPDPEHCQRYGIGMDFGYTTDPTGIVECALFQDGLYLRELCYETGLLTTPNHTRPDEPSIEGRLNDLGIGKDVKIYADCAEAKSIADLNLSGFNVVPSDKSKGTSKFGSIIDGINIMKKYKIYIHKASHNLLVEFENYKWAKNTLGVDLGKPIDEYNHLIDGARYWARTELQMHEYAKKGHGRSYLGKVSGRQPRSRGRQFR